MSGGIRVQDVEVRADRSVQATPARHQRRRLQDLAGISASALLIGLGSASSETIDTSSLPIMRMPTPINGVDAHTEGSLWWKVDVPATAGGAGRVLDYRNNVVVNTSGLGRAIEIGSVGGRGGAGLKADMEAAMGGAGGAVTFTQAASARQTGDLPATTTPVFLNSLVAAYSQGGRGGAGNLATIEGYRELYASAGAGGAAGDVTVTHLSSIETSARYLGGLIVSSKGGAGGEYGIFSEGSAKAANAGHGGESGRVTLTIDKAASVTTNGLGAAAVVLESLAGDGASVTGGSDTAGAPAASVARVPGKPSVSLSSAGTIITRGDYAPAFLLQSVGGQGGKGGASAGSGRGTDGGAGGAGGEISAVLSGAIETSGAYAYGLVAQSVGGTGGWGGGGVITGGLGGDAGNSGAVTITNSGTILTRGNGSAGLVAQSVGGGNAVRAFQSNLVNPPSGGGGAGGNATFLFFSTGGAGGTGGNGDTVTVNNSNRVETLGRDAYGLLAQSIGGGGGGGGDASAFGLIYSKALGGSAGYGGEGRAVTVMNSLGTGPGAAQGRGIFTGGEGSSGIVAQSIGGGGGAGGAAEARTFGVQAAVAVAIGASGGSGGNGDAVQVTNATSITTKGSRANGIEGMSIGGGGGIGGASLAEAVSLGAIKQLPSIAVAVGLGGTGGKGGDGRNVTINNTGAITTGGSDARGLMGLSIGGGGGQGGFADVAASTVGGASVINLSVGVGIGGSGGVGGSGGTVRMTNTQSLKTGGDQATAMFAGSFGGGGGIGGGADVAGYGLGGGKAVSVNVALGGTGGTGNVGGTVNLSNSGGIETAGFASMGIHGISIGGGGGVGGAGASKSSTHLDGTLGNVPLSAASTMTATLAVGGAGGTGGSGGTVDLTNTGAIMTSGADARGILAQSIGGGGGLASSAHASTNNKISGSFSIGGKGGSGNDGGLVTVVNKAGAEIETHGEGAFGIQAQSIGGGGGSGGSGSAGPQDDFLGTLYKEAKSFGLKSVVFNALPKLTARRKWSHSAPVTVSYGQSIGGTGGAGGAGSVATVTNNGTITTYGTGAAGVFAQSVGGGGGNGGASTTPGAKLVNIKVSLGGDGGAGGVGGAVTTTNSGTINTGGASAFGMFAQSIGGGGGLAAMGIEEGGSPFDPVTLTTGGTGGAYGTGGRVIVDNSGTIATTGADAHGIVAQSVGGGGGLLLLNRSDAFAAADLKGVFTSAEKDALKRIGIDVDAVIADAEKGRQQATKQSQAYTLQLGGNKVQGNGGDVTVKSLGTITTSGANAFGILAQSIGGGGGIVSGGQASPSSQVKATGRIGGLNGTTGDGRQVTVELGAGSSITTTGTGATAIFAQSIGGGGGYGGALNTGAPDSVRFPSADGRSSGRGGNVRIEMSSASGTTTIKTVGANAHGIFAQSLGGGGGALGSAGGLSLTNTLASTGNRGTDAQSGGAIDIDLRGKIDTAGAGAVGIFAQSGMQGVGGDIIDGSALGAITLKFDGHINGGSGTGAAIQLDGGRSNTITLAKDAEVKARSGQAILTTSGKNTVLNHGTVIGDVVMTRLAGEGNAFENSATGIYRSAGTGIVALGHAGTFANAGIFDIAGRGAIGTAVVSADFTQSAEGRLQVDVSSTRSVAEGRSDLLKVNGNLTLGGTIVPYVVGGLRQDTFQVASATGALVAADLQAGANPASPISWSAQANGRTVAITPSANFVAPAGMAITPTESALLPHLQQIWDAGSISAGNALLFGNLANVTSATDYLEAVDSLSPDESASVAALQTLAASVSMQHAMSCPAFAGTGTLMQETSCAWARVTGNWTRQSSSHDTTGYSQRAATYRLGGQHEFARDWFLGATVGYTHSNLSDNHGFSRTSGDALDASVALKHQIGPWLLAASGHFGWGRYDTDRTLNIGPSLAASGGQSTVWTAAGRLRASYEFAQANWYIKPYADIDLLYTSVPGYSESGSGLTHLRFASAQQWNVAFTPAIEFGGRIDLDPQTWLRPYASVGVTFLAKDSMRIRAGFSDSSLGVADFLTEVAMPGRLVNLTAGAQLFSGEGYDVRAEYKAGIGDRYLSQEVSARLAIPF